MKHHRSKRSVVCSLRIALRHFIPLSLVLSAELSLQSAPGVPRALPPSPQPQDVRLSPLKDLDGYFPLIVPESKQFWAERSEYVRRRLQVALGLWPAPTKTPLNPVIHGKIDREDYTVEKVFFESVPGFYVTGNLYRPKGKTGPLPAILSPHGHWANGRFTDSGADGVKKEIARGEERFEDGGRSPLQSRCVHLARMGCVVFHYDMIGYADSTQISENLAHRFSKQRPEMNTPEKWGFFSPQAEMHLQSIMGLQTWNSIRALDFLTSLPDVDASRIGVTGASGGGTQTFILGALDSRPKVAFPAVMVSTAMQGGCTCENASLLRVETGNVEIAGLFAPKPLGMTAANDWTKEMATKGFPELQALFKLLGSPNNVALFPSLHYGHNYNAVSRSAMYGWMNRHLNLGLSEPLIEREYKRLTDKELTVWDASHQRPPGGPEFEKSLLEWLHKDAQITLVKSLSSLESFKNLFAPAIDIVIGRTFTQVGTVEMNITQREKKESYEQVVGLLRNKNYHEEIPVVMLQPSKSNNRVVVWITDTGKAGLYKTEQKASVELLPNVQLLPEIEALLKQGFTVIGADLMMQGEFLTGVPIPVLTRRVSNPRESAAYTFGYNHSLFAQRTHDIMTVIQYLKAPGNGFTSIDLVGLSGSGPWVAAAKAQAGKAVRRTVVNTSGFRFGNITNIHDPQFLPGGAKYADLPGILALAAPDPLWVCGESRIDSIVEKVYQAVPATENLQIHKEVKVKEILTWLSM